MERIEQPKMVNVRMDQARLQEVQNLADERSCTVSAVVRSAVDDYLRRENVIRSAVAQALQAQR